jgi:RNA polymerase sigma-70 factor (ECF subfamily)
LKGSVRDIAAEDSPDSAAQHERFWQLYEEGLPHVYGYLLRRSDKATAEDLTQEVFLDLARRARGGGAHELTVGWLMVVARSRLLDHVRARQRADRKLRLAWSATDAQERDGMVDVDPTDAGLEPATERALDALPQVQRCVLVLHHLDGYSVGEVATAIGRSVRATESLLARARRAFRTAFEEASDA